MARAVKDVSIKWSDKSHKRDSQPGTGKNVFAERILLRIADLRTTAAEVARLAGIPSSTFSRYTSGQSLPNSEQLFPLADALQCSARWLMQGDVPAPLFEASEVDWINLPRYPLSGFTPEGKPDADGRVPLPKNWLRLVSAATDKLWVTTVSGSVGDWLAEGEDIVCADLDGEIVDGRIYIFMIDGRTIIRRAFVQADGYQLITGDPMTPPLTVPRDFAEQGPFPVARVVGKFRFNPM